MDDFTALCDEASLACQAAYQAMKAHEKSPTDGSERRMSRSVDRFFSCHKKVMDSYREAHQNSRRVPTQLEESKEEI